MTTFGLGSHTITGSASDAAGNGATAVSFTFAVADETAPVITVTPPAATIAATSAAGAVVTFSGTAADAVDGSDAVVFREGTALVTSGETFSLGAHSIVATAVDSAGNGAAPAYFAFTVTTPSQSHSVAATAMPAPPTRFDTIIYNIHFSNNVEGVDASDFMLLQGSLKASIVSVTGSGSDFVVTLGDLSGAGSLSLGLAAKSSIFDAGGHPIAVALKSTAFMRLSLADGGSELATYAADGLSHQTQFDAAGNVVRDYAVTYNADGSKQSTHQATYGATGLLQDLTIVFNSDGTTTQRLVVPGATIAAEVDTYGSKGLVHQTQYDALGDVLRDTAVIRNADGTTTLHVVTAGKTYAAEDDTYGPHGLVHQTQYDASGNVLRDYSITYNADGTDQSTHQTTYDAVGHQLQDVTITFNADGTSTQRLVVAGSSSAYEIDTYGAKGLTRQTQYDASGHVLRDVAITYNANGTTTQHVVAAGTSYASEDDTYGPKGLTRQTQYNASGHVLRDVAITYNADGTTTQHVVAVGTSYASEDDTYGPPGLVHQRQYDASGHVLRDVAITYNGDGTTTQHVVAAGTSYASEDDTYGPHGLVRQTQYDASGHILRDYSITYNADGSKQSTHQATYGATGLLQDLTIVFNSDGTTTQRLVVPGATIAAEVDTYGSKGLIHQTQYDALGDVLRDTAVIRNADGTTTLHVVTAGKTYASEDDTYGPHGLVHQTQYDASGHVIHDVAFAYDSDGTKHVVVAAADPADQPLDDASPVVASSRADTPSDPEAPPAEPVVAEIDSPLPAEGSTASMTAAQDAVHQAAFGPSFSIGEVAEAFFLGGLVMPARGRAKVKTPSAPDRRRRLRSPR